MIEIDVEGGTVTVVDEGSRTVHDLASPAAFAIISSAWLRCGWDTKYVYGFSWFGRPVIQLPEDLLRAQAAIYDIRPTVVIETGVAHGGSLVFYASLCAAMGRGRVIGIDIEIRPHNRRAIEEHELSGYITLLEGSSTDERLVSSVTELVSPDDRVLVLLDSNHSKSHVLEELRAYAPLVSVGSYIVATDGIMKDLVGAPRSGADWASNNPQDAVAVFLAERDDFVLDTPSFGFNEGSIIEPVTYWPNGWLRRTR